MTTSLPTPPGAAGSPAALRRTGPLGRLAALAHRRRHLVVLLWVAALAAAVGLSGAFGGEFEEDYTVPGSESRAAMDLLAERFPAVSGETADLVVTVEDSVPGGVEDPAVRDAVRDAVAGLAEVPHVRSVEDPYAVPGAVSPDGSTLLAGVQLDVLIAEEMPLEDTERLLAVVEELDAVEGVDAVMGGQVVALAEQGEIGSEGIGLLAAAVILLVTFGSVVAAGLPLLVAVAGLAVSSATIGLFAAVFSVPEWATSLATMMGIGVGIDYVLLMVTRYREYTARGMSVADATVATVETAGRAVLVAGTTVVISMLGLSAMGLSFMTGAAVVTIMAVLVVMLAAITLLPALLGYLGRHLDRLRLPGRHLDVTAGSPAWARWSRLVQRRALPAAVLGIVVLLGLAAPFLGVRFGFPDASNDSTELSTRQAYDRVAEAFGPGANGPLLLAAELPDGSVEVVEQLAEVLAGTEGVAAVSPPQLNEAGDTAVLTVVPTTGPQQPETEDLVETLREDVVPSVVDGTGTSVHVGGIVASVIDSNEDVASRLPLLIAGVVGLSMLLLLAVFRSVAIAVKAAVVNLLSIGAAYGVVAMVLEGGWLGELVGIPTETPLPAFIPVLMFAILFGLSMDYEVFLVSRMREHWLHSRDESSSVAEGLAGTARVITAAAAIMVAVFAAFIPSEQVFLKVIGIGMATAIFIDATIVRMLVVPAVMQLMGRRTWWMPAWLDRLVPQAHVEGPDELLAVLAVPAPRQPLRDRSERPEAVEA